MSLALGSAGFRFDNTWPTAAAIAATAVTRSISLVVNAAGEAAGGFMLIVVVVVEHETQLVSFQVVV